MLALCRLRKHGSILSRNNRNLNLTQSMLSHTHLDSNFCLSFIKLLKLIPRVLITRYLKTLSGFIYGHMSSYLNWTEMEESVKWLRYVWQGWVLSLHLFMLSIFFAHVPYCLFSSACCPNFWSLKPCTGQAYDKTFHESCNLIYIFPIVVLFITKTA